MRGRLSVNGVCPFYFPVLLFLLLFLRRDFPARRFSLNIAGAVFFTLISVHFINIYRISAYKIKLSDFSVFKQKRFFSVARRPSFCILLNSFDKALLSTLK